MCNDLSTFIKEIFVDDYNKYTLFRCIKSKSCTKIVYSDHNVLGAKFSLKFNDSVKPTRKEIYKYKSPISKEKFRVSTSLTDSFTNSMDEPASFKSKCNKFLKEFKSSIHKNFKKIRVTDTKNKNNSKMSTQLN